MLVRKNLGFQGKFQVHFLNIPGRVLKKELGITSCNKRFLYTTTTYNSV